jgi:hypothetical protein
MEKLPVMSPIELPANMRLKYSLGSEWRKQYASVVRDSESVKKSLTWRMLFDKVPGMTAFFAASRFSHQTKPKATEGSSLYGSKR